MSEQKEWRVGKKVPVNVYEGDRPICQCHTALDAKRIVEAVNSAAQGERVVQLENALRNLLNSGAFEYHTDTSDCEICVIRAEANAILEEKPR